VTVLTQTPEGTIATDTAIRRIDTVIRLEPVFAPLQ
jgi:hypothetical protein